MNSFNNYRKKNVQPMRPYVEGESMEGISVNKEDTPEIGGMIAVNPKNPEDKWYVAKKFFEDNYELAESPIKPDALAEKVELDDATVLDIILSYHEATRIPFPTDDRPLKFCKSFRPANVDALAEENKRLRETLERARADINWMLNNKQFLNADVFDYLEQALGGKTEGESNDKTDKV